jgi:hypothetical protein
MPAHESRLCNQEMGLKVFVAVGRQPGQFGSGRLTRGSPLEIEAAKGR